MNKFCVYIHFRNDNSQPFYVGQGTTIRPFSTTRKNKDWNSVVKDAGGFFPVIVKSDLSKTEALKLETELIHLYGSRVVNIQTTSSTIKELDFDTFNSKFYVDRESLTGLRYKCDIYVKKTKFFSAGDIAGNPTHDGYFQISHNHKCYRVHRIIYLLSHGKLDSSLIIDHINGNGLDNRTENLRAVSYQDNRRNLAKDKRNISGVTGVSNHANNTCRAAISHGGKRYTISFSFSKYGKEKAMELAVAWYNNKREELNAAGAGYTDRHGT